MLNVELFMLNYSRTSYKLKHAFSISISITLNGIIYYDEYILEFL